MPSSTSSPTPSSGCSRLSMRNNLLEYHLKLLGKSLREVTDPRIIQEQILYIMDIIFFTELIQFYTYFSSSMSFSFLPLRASRFGPKRGILLHPVFPTKL